jgi:hypothetical protein
VSTDAAKGKAHSDHPSHVSQFGLCSAKAMTQLNSRQSDSRLNSQKHHCHYVTATSKSQVLRFEPAATLERPEESVFPAGTLDFARDFNPIAVNLRAPHPFRWRVAVVTIGHTSRCCWQDRQRIAERVVRSGVWPGASPQRISLLPALVLHLSVLLRRNHATHKLAVSKNHQGKENARTNRPAAL